MGTNFYFFTGLDRTCTCPECGHEHKVPERIHIGKSSFGWYFTLHKAALADGSVLTNLADWVAFIKDHPQGHIEDEYHQPIKLEDLIPIIKRSGKTYDNSARRKDLKQVEGDVVPEQSGYGYLTLVGKKGLLYVNTSQLGEDGLYTISDADFC